MSSPTIPVVSKGGDVATGVALKGGAIALMPAAVGGRRRGSKKMTKKMKKMLKALKMMKGGAVGDAVNTANLEESGLGDIQTGTETEEGGRRRRRSRKGGKSRRRSSKRSSSKGFFA
jgi:hypothetical protein